MRKRIIKCLPLDENQYPKDYFQRWDYQKEKTLNHKDVYKKVAFFRHVSKKMALIISW